MEDLVTIIMVIVFVVLIIKMILKSIIKKTKESLAAIRKNIDNSRTRKRLTALYLQGKVHINYEEWKSNFDPKFTFKLRNPYISELDVKDYKEKTGKNIRDIREGDKLMIFPDDKHHELLRKNKIIRYNLYPKSYRQILLCTADKVIIGRVGSIKLMFDDQSHYHTLYEDLIDKRRWDVYVKEVRKNSDGVIDSADIMLCRYISEDELKNRIIECETTLIDLLNTFLIGGYSRKRDYIIDGISVTKEFDSSMKNITDFRKKNSENEDFCLKYGFKSFGECYDHIRNIKNVIDFDCHYTGDTVRVEYDNWSYYNSEPKVKNYKVGEIDYMFRTPENNFMTIKVSTDYKMSGSDFYNLRVNFKDYISFGKSPQDLISVIRNKELKRPESWLQKMNKREEDFSEFY